jgi:uncharacterized membrane protein (DUF485 family)
LDHGPATEWKEDNSEDFKTRLGLVMFAFYFVLYIAFILICVLSPRTLGMDAGSLNLAIVYGFALIVIAIVQAVVYNAICSKHEHRHAKPESGEESA